MFGKIDWYIEVSAENQTVGDQPYRWRPPEKGGGRLPNMDTDSRLPRENMSFVLSRSRGTFG